MEPITIFEHGEWPSSENEKENAKNIKFDQSDKKILKFLEEKKIIDIDDLKNKGIRIKAKNFIGTVRFSEFSLRIIPKIYKKSDKKVWKNIAQCMHFARNYSPEKMIQYEKIPISSDDLILQDFLIWTLVYECQELLRKGLLKSYVIHDENLPYLKGKLILKNQFLNDVRKKVQFFCEYDELEFDNIENRIILQTLVQCRQISIHSELKKAVFKLIQQFSGVVQTVPITIPDIIRVSRDYTRQNAHYKDAHIICEMLLANQGISDFYHHGQKSSFSIPFFVNMDNIFEDFVTRLFKKYHKDDVTAQASQKAWNIDEGDSRKSMRPDIILRNDENNTMTIIDVKYKEELKESDLYQIGFYIHEYKDVYKEEKRGKAYAILPRYYETSQSDHSFEATKSKIKIYEKHISIDSFVDLIKNNKENELRKKLTELLNPN